MSQPLRILLLEDSPVDAELTERALRKTGLSFESRRAQGRDAFLQALDAFRPDIVLADYKLPQFDGRQALELVRERDVSLPFIFVTGALGEEGAVELLCAGASDYILKDRLTRLGSAIERALETRRQQAALEAAQRALRESEARFRALVETTLDWLWEVDAEARYTYVSPMSKTLLGYAPEDMIGRRPFDFMRPEERERAAGVFASIAASRRPFSMLENHCLHKDGHKVVMETSGAPVFGEDGSFLGYRGIDRDITARKRSEERLRQLSLAVEQSPTSIVITDLEGRIEYVNPAFTGVSGYGFEEALGQNPRILNSGRTPPEVHQDLWETLMRGEVWRGEFINRRKDGEDYVERAIISPVRQPDGRVTHYLAVKEDITEKKRVEEELEHYRLNLEALVETRTAELTLSEERSRLILESSADGLFGQDTEGRVTFINPAACAMLGYQPEEVLGRSMHALIHHSRADGEALPKSDCPIHSALGEHYIVRQDEDLFWRADGRPFPVTYSSHPMYRDGEVVGSVVSFIDISVQKQTEAAREAALAEAERLTRLKSEFLANMSHEIRTPLNAVLGFAQVGERQSEGRKARDYFKRILDSGQLLLGIVNDILDFSKMEAGKLVIGDGEVDLRELIERTTGLLTTRIEDQGLRFRVDEAPDLPASFRGDDLRLAQVLGNLLSNAIKFTERGEVRLAVERDAGRLGFSVTDTGIGMSEAQIANLYHPFEQADGSITRRFGGTGLGLAISKRLTELMGGEIRVSSELGQGTCFELWIPLVAPKGIIGVDRIAARDAGMAGARERLRGLVILVAEDNPANRLVLEELLNEEGCWLVQVDNGLEAVERVDQDGAGAFDLVLMDIQMPVMDGLEATDRIRALAPGLPIIGLTAHALQSEREHCLAAGMVDHVAKPIDLDTLIAAILRHARRKSDAGRALHAAPSSVAGAEPGGCRCEAPSTVRAPESWVNWPALETRYARNPAFVPRLLGAILESNADQSAALRRAADGAGLEDVVFIAHRLKGTAGTLLADGLLRLAARAEAHAREGRSEASRSARRLADALDAVLGEIRASRWMTHPRPDPEPAGGARLDGDALSEVVERLKALLAMDDTSANEVYDHDQALLIQAFGDDAKRLGGEIKRFDYQVALETLTALIERDEQPC